MKKAFSIIKSCLTWALIVIAVCVMLFTIVSAIFFDKNDRSFLGYKMYIVKTDSMAATDFSAGDLIFVKELGKGDKLKIGDIITYQSQSTDSYGEIITHKIKRTSVDAEGNPGFITYGTTTGVEDETVVTYSFIIGKYTGHIPAIGRFFNFLKTPVGYIICILIPFMTLIIIQAVKSINLFRQYKREQTAEMEEERRQLEEERARSAEMLAELKRLQEELSAKSAAPAAAPEADPIPANNDGEVKNNEDAQ